MKNTKIVAIGGGHGLSTILHTLKDFTYLSAIVTVTDSGGSTGKIRTSFNCPAIGDIRRCLDTLGNEKMKDIFERRIKDYGDCVGNLIIASLVKLYDFNTAIKIMHKLLGLKETHNIYPVSLQSFNICGEYLNTKIITKETDFNQEEKIKKIWLNPNPNGNPEAIEAIKNSNVIIICPGSFFTSILSNLLIPEIAEEINKKKIIWFVNAMQQFGETIGMDANEHANYLLKSINHVDYAIINTGIPSGELYKQFEYPSYLMPLNYIRPTNEIKHIIYDDLIKVNENGIVHSPIKTLKVLRRILNE